MKISTIIAAAEREADPISTLNEASIVEHLRIDDTVRMLPLAQIERVPASGSADVRLQTD